MAEPKKTLVPHLPTGTLRHGWAWGYTESREWLTIPGSAIVAPRLAVDLSEAPLPPPPAMLATDWPIVLAHVAEVPHAGMTGPRRVAYRILEVSPAHREVPR